MLLKLLALLWLAPLPSLVASYNTTCLNTTNVLQRYHYPYEPQDVCLHEHNGYLVTGTRNGKACGFPPFGARYGFPPLAAHYESKDRRCYSGYEMWCQDYKIQFCWDLSHPRQAGAYVEEHKRSHRQLYCLLGAVFGVVVWARCILSRRDNGFIKYGAYNAVPVEIDASASSSSVELSALPVAMARPVVRKKLHKKKRKASERNLYDGAQSSCLTVVVVSEEEEQGVEDGTMPLAEAHLC